MTSCRHETKIFCIVFIASLQLVYGVGNSALCTHVGNNVISDRSIIERLSVSLNILLLHLRPRRIRGIGIGGRFRAIRKTLSTPIGAEEKPGRRAQARLRKLD